MAEFLAIASPMQLVLFSALRTRSARNACGWITAMQTSSMICVDADVAYDCHFTSGDLGQLVLKHHAVFGKNCVADSCLILVDSTWTPHNYHWVPLSSGEIFAHYRHPDHRATFTFNESLEFAQRGQHNDLQDRLSC